MNTAHEVSKLVKGGYEALTGKHEVNVGTTERIASIAGGALLTYYGLKKKSLFAKAIAAAGSALLLRGVSGYCPVNEEIGRDTSEKDNDLQHVPKHYDTQIPAQVD